MKNIKSIGIDLGATNIRGAVVDDGQIGDIKSKILNTLGSEQQVLDDVFEITDSLFNNTIKAIGIGVPSVVDIKQGIVYDVQHIPSWKEVPLKKIMEERYQVPVLVNNDANCFALGEYYFGKGQGFFDMVGLTLGTGLGAGIIVNKQLYGGHNCGAGEFGMVDYLERNYEYYCSGSFFQNVYGFSGEEVFAGALKSAPWALIQYEELGKHLGNVIKLVMYSYDPEMIILGGSVAQAFHYFQKSMWQQIKTFGYPKSIERIKIERSDLKNSAILGAAALCIDDSL